MEYLSLFITAIAFSFVSICELANAQQTRFMQPQDAKPSSAATKFTHDMRLYTLNGGYLDMENMDSFSYKSVYPHHQLRLADPCFLIKHPKGWLLWDTGLGDQYVGRDFKEHHASIIVPTSLSIQLKQLGLQPNDINYVALSHAHFDHTGNIKLFSQATFIMQKSEYDFIQQEPLSSAVEANTFQILKNRRKILLHGDYDVFGDGALRVLSTPGHTPGHESLEILLEHHGTIILSGDLYHTREAYFHKLIPVFNSSPAETLASMSRIDNILRETHGRLIIQHDLDEISSLRKIPDYLD
jgi:N-acyl homoserine lactone hydrolase